MSQIVCVEDNWANSESNWPVIGGEITVMDIAIFMLNVGVELIAYFGSMFTWE